MPQAKKKKAAAPKKLKPKDIDYSVAQFGSWLSSSTDRSAPPKLCDLCGKERACWKHVDKLGARYIYLCFGCHEDNIP
jgi:hypothetical protein